MEPVGVFVLAMAVRSIPRFTKNLILEHPNVSERAGLLVTTWNSCGRWCEAPCYGNPDVSHPSAPTRQFAPSRAYAVPTIGLAGAFPGVSCRVGAFAAVPKSP